MEIRFVDTKGRNNAAFELFLCRAYTELKFNVTNYCYDIR